jgi:hypothetical protein
MHKFPHASFRGSTITTFSAAISQHYALSHAQDWQYICSLNQRCIFACMRSQVRMYCYTYNMNSQKDTTILHTNNGVFLIIVVMIHTNLDTVP